MSPRPWRACRDGLPTVSELKPDAAPAWLRPLVDGLGDLEVDEMLRHRMDPPPEARRAAVLMLFGEHPAHGPDVLLAERASTLRSHAGQVAFPGGGHEVGDAGPIGTALREAEEETGLEPSGVVPLALLPELYIPPSGFVVTPVLAHWARPSAVHAVDAGETATVVRVPLAQLADPANRLRIRHPSGITGPAFIVSGLLVWGFTGGLLSAMLDRGGWTRPWDTARILDLDRAWRAARTGRQEVTGL
jgi:8-oxo-dGTP pyrophosphatase MutT (NUDIX family)